MAELLSWKPAQRFGLASKGDIAPGYDADIVIVDPHESFVVHAAESESHQGYTPFEGCRASRPGEKHVLAGRACLRWRQCRRAGAWQIFAPSGSRTQAVKRPDVGHSYDGWQEI